MVFPFFKIFSLFIFHSHGQDVFCYPRTYHNLGLFYRNFLAEIFSLILQNSKCREGRDYDTDINEFWTSSNGVIGTSLQCMVQVVCLEFFAKVFFILWTCNLMLFPFYDFCTEIDKPLLVNLSYPTISGIIATSTSHLTAESA